MEEQNNPKKQNYEIIPQSQDEIESLNDNEELDIDSLEEIAGGGWGCNCRGTYIEIGIEDVATPTSISTSTSTSPKI